MIENDKSDIFEVLNLYAFALDARQWDLFDPVFTDDVSAGEIGFLKAIQAK